MEQPYTPVSVCSKSACHVPHVQETDGVPLDCFVWKDRNSRYYAASSAFLFSFHGKKRCWLVVRFEMNACSSLSIGVQTSANVSTLKSQQEAINVPNWTNSIYRIVHSTSLLYCPSHRYDDVWWISLEMRVLNGEWHCKKSVKCLRMFLKLIYGLWSMVSVRDTL